MVDVTVGENKFGYAELRTGARGIKVWIMGIKADPVSYKFSPDPHDDKKYIKSPPKFYLEAAGAIGKYYNDHEKKFPATGVKIKSLGAEYKLEKL